MKPNETLELEQHIDNEMHEEKQGEQGKMTGVEQPGLDDGDPKCIPEQPSIAEYLMEHLEDIPEQAGAAGDVHQDEQPGDAVGAVPDTHPITLSPTITGAVARYVPVQLNSDYLPVLNEKPLGTEKELESEMHSQTGEQRDAPRTVCQDAV